MHQSYTTRRDMIHSSKVNWTLDADIQAFFDTIDHVWILKFLEHRIADGRILRLIRKWLTAGVIEDEERKVSQVGSPQGAVISPLLAKIYLHYVFGLWTHRWRPHEADGDMILVRYADDSVVGLEQRQDIKTFLAYLRTRMAKFSSKLKMEKTRVLEFGRYARQNAPHVRVASPEDVRLSRVHAICASVLNHK